MTRGDVVVLVCGVPTACVGMRARVEDARGDVLMLTLLETRTPTWREGATAGVVRAEVRPWVPALEDECDTGSGASTTAAT